METNCQSECWPTAARAASRSPQLALQPTAEDPSESDLSYYGARYYDPLDGRDSTRLMLNNWKKQCPIHLIRRGDAHRFFFRLRFAHRQNREVLIPAGFATERGHAEQAPQESQGTVHIMRGNALQLQVAANRAVRVEGIAQRHQPRMKSCVAGAASPRINAQSAQRIVCYRMAPRSSCTNLLTHGAGHLRVGLSSEFRPE